MKAEHIDYGNVFESIIIGEGKHMAIFSNGTCVIFHKSQDNIEQEATSLMMKWGPVSAGSSAGDFSIIHLDEYPGWLVTSHHDDIITYVAPSEGEFDVNEEVAIGFYGRSKRDTDSSELSIIHTAYVK